MQYVIIGNGVAAIGAVEGIRKHDPDGGILLVSDEDKMSYGRPLISYYLAGTVGQEAMSLRPEDYYQRLGVEVRLSTRITELDPGSRTLTTESGDTISYDRLLLATGGVPIPLDVPGMDGPGIHTFTTWADADALETVASRGGRVAVIGAGLIALKAGEALVQRGVNTTLVVRSRIMRAYFDEVAGEMVEQHLVQKGMKFFHQATPREVRRESGKVVGVETDKGLVPADAVIVAVGVRPRTRIAEAAGIEVDYGISVDSRMRTSDPHVFAAGDCVMAPDMLTGKVQNTPIWPNAYNQGLNAGVNMAGADQDYPGGLSMNAITFFGLPTISVGLVNVDPAQGYEVHADVDPALATYRKLVFSGDRLVGCMLVGDIDNAGIYTSFIKNQLALDEEAKREMVHGQGPSPLYWPTDFFETNMDAV